MPASTVGYTLLPIPPRIRIVPRSTNNSTPNAASPIVLCGRILANAAVPLVLTDALHASDLLPKMRIRFDSHASNVAEDDENTLWTDSQDYGADEILYTTGIVLIDKTGKLMHEITTLFGVYPQLFYNCSIRFTQVWRPIRTASHLSQRADLTELSERSFSIRMACGGEGVSGEGLGGPAEVLSSGRFVAHRSVLAQVWTSQVFSA